MALTDRANIEAFLAGRRIAFVGVSTDERDFSRAVMKELVAKGYDVVPVHPRAERIAGREAYARVTDVPGALDGALVMTRPELSAQIVRDCAAACVGRVWLHRGVGHGSVSEEALEVARAEKLDVGAGECPLLFLRDTQQVHRAHAFCKKVVGTYPGPDPRPSRARRVLAVLRYALAAWAVCAGTMALATTVLGDRGVAVVYAVTAPAVFALVAFVYARARGELSPFALAAVLVGTALALDAGLVAPLLLRSFAMFASVTGTWLPLGLGFFAAWAAGAHARRGSAVATAHAQ